MHCRRVKIVKRRTWNEIIEGIQQRPENQTEL